MCGVNKKSMDFILSLLKAGLYIALLVVFVLLMSVSNPQILRISRTTAIVISTFALLLYVFGKIYGGYRIGQQKSRPIIYQMGLSVLLTDIITYVQLQIMNVNEANNDHLILFDENLLYLVIALIIQFALIYGATYLGNYLFFKAHKPQKCCVITANAKDRDIICRKIAIFDKQFVVTDCAFVDDTDVKDRIKASQTVMLFRLPAARHQELIEYCYKHQKSIYFDLAIGDILAQNSGSFLLDDVPMTAHTRVGLNIKQRVLKRTLDIVLASIGLVMTSPLMLIAAISIKSYDHGSVFFRQTRITRGGREFMILKFRTMIENQTGKDHSALKDDERITRPGKWLRRMRIDELPQILNILKGDMSIVGPRPEMLANVEKYTDDMPEFKYRTRVKAGLTGYAQILGKYNTDPHEKLMMDVMYIENYSFWLDIKLILKTFTVFFKKDSTEEFDDKGQRDK